MTNRSPEDSLRAGALGTVQVETEPDPFDDLAAEAAPRRPIGPPWLTGPGVWARRRPIWASVIALSFLLNALGEVLVAGMLPLLPPVLPGPVVWVGFILGAASLAAALGILRGLEWARWLGVALTAFGLARYVAITEGFLRSVNERGAPDPLLGILVPFAINGAVLLLLLFRWPRRSPSHGPDPEVATERRDDRAGRRP